MNELDENFILIIDKAIRVEIGAYELYKNKCQVCMDKELRNFLTELAVEELRHKRILEHFKKTADFEEAKALAYNEDLMNKIYSDQKQEDAHLDLQKLEDFFNRAIDMELEMMNFYKQQLGKFDDEQIRKLVQHLVDFENEHADKLKNRRDNLIYDKD